MDKHRCSFEAELGNLKCGIILENGFFRPDLPWGSSTHMHSSIECRYLKEGEYELIVGGERHILKSGKLYIVKPFVHHGAGNNSLVIKKLSFMLSFEKSKMHDPDDTDTRYASTFSAYTGDMITLAPERFYLEKLIACSEEYAGKGRIDTVKLRALFTLVISDMLEKLEHGIEFKDSAISENETTELNEETERRFFIEDFVYENFKDDIKLCDLAEHLHLSVRQTNRFLKERMGTSFTELLKTQRIAHSKKLLSEGKMNLSDICFEVGYKSYNGFSAAFKSVTGMIPGEYVKKFSE